MRPCGPTGLGQEGHREVSQRAHPARGQPPDGANRPRPGIVTPDMEILEDSEDNLSGVEKSKEELLKIVRRELMRRKKRNRRLRVCKEAVSA